SDADEAHRVAPGAARQPTAADDRHFAAAGQADATAEEQGGRDAVAALPARVAGATEGEDALPLEEELALLRVEQPEAAEIDLGLVFLDLRKIGVVGEV